MGRGVKCRGFRGGLFQFVEIQSAYCLYIILLKEYILFIGCLYYFSVQFNSCYFYIRVMESWRYKRDYLHASIDILLQI